MTIDDISMRAACGQPITKQEIISLCGLTRGLVIMKDQMQAATDGAKRAADLARQAAESIVLDRTVKRQLERERQKADAQSDMIAAMVEASKRQLALQTQIMSVIDQMSTALDKALPYLDNPMAVIVTAGGHTIHSPEAAKELAENIRRILRFLRGE